MSFYSNVTNRAGAAIKKRGAAMTLRRTIKATPDENTGIMGTATVTDYPCFGLIQYFDSRAANLMYGTSTMRESLIQKEDQLIMLAAQDLDVTPTAVIDALIFNNTTYNVVSCLPLNPGGVAIIYNVHVRR